MVVNDRGFVVADGAQRTANPNVFAVGDVVADTPQLAHVGFAEAIVAIKTILGEATVPVDYDRVPWAIYSNPEVAFCGLTEVAAKEKGYDCLHCSDRRHALDSVERMSAEWVVLQRKSGHDYRNGARLY